MRILMILLLAFCIGSGLSSSLSALILFSASAFLLLLAAALIGFVCGRRELRLILIFLGLSAGLIHGSLYRSLYVDPALSLSGTEAEITAVAADYSTSTDYGERVEAKAVIGGQTFRVSLLLGEEEAVSPGDIITGAVRLRDSAASGSYYNYASGIYLNAYASGEMTITSPQKISFLYLPRRVAHALEESLASVMDEDSLGMAVALTTGSRSGLSDEIVSSMKRAGIYHALALSGMHLAVLLTILLFPVRSSKRRAFLGIPICVAFTLITGAGASMVRACIMEIILLAAPVLGRRGDTPTSLSAALFLLVLQDPWCLLSTGVQLSFLSVLGIYLFGGRYYRRFRRDRKWKHKFPDSAKRYLVESISVSLGAMTATLPVMAAQFGYLSLIAPVSNLLTGFVVSLCLAFSLLTAVIGMFSVPLAAVPGFAARICIRYISLVSGLCARVPVLYTGTFAAALWLSAIAALVLWMLFHASGRKIIPVSLIALLTAVFIFANVFSGSKDSFTAVDVGQGQCLVLHTGSRTVMIDCGGNDSPGLHAASCLQSLGEDTVDLLILTHCDDDHVNGLADILRQVTVSQAVMGNVTSEENAEVSSLLTQSGVPISFVSEDEAISVGDALLQIYAPQENSEGNAASLAILIQGSPCSVLITGDMDSDSERILLAHAALPDVDVLVAGHHGSAYSTSEALLDTVTPETALISVGVNSYGHPAEETLQRLHEAGAEILRTDLQGNIVIKGD